MRWERLFADLAAGFDDEAADERDALAEELTAESWAAVRWRDVLGAAAVLEVAGVGRLEGEVQFAGAEVIHLVTPVEDLVVLASAVVAVHNARVRTRAAAESRLELGWRPVLRAVAGEPVRVHLRSGQCHDGVIDAVGADFVRLAAQNLRVFPISAVAVVRSRR